MNLLGVETHFPDKNSTNAADYWRTISPLKELAKHSQWKIETRRGLISEEAAKDLKSIKAEEEWAQLGMRYHIVYYSYNTNPINFSYAKVVTEKFNHTLIMDFDDNILHPDFKNPTEVIARMNGKKEDVANRVVLEEVPYMTVTSEYLKKSYTEYLNSVGIKKQIFVIPNFIDADLYNTPIHKNNGDKIVIGFFGSTSHQADLYEKHFHKALSKIKRRYPHVVFEVIGNFVPDYLNGLGSFTKIEGSNDFYTWIKLWKKYVSKWDIGVAPLRDTIFNRSRSNCKWQELALAKVPLVASDIGLYTSDTVYKARSTQDWYHSLEILIKDKELRIQRGESAHKEVMDDWTIQGNWEKWKEMFEKVCNS